MGTVLLKKRLKMFFSSQEKTGLDEKDRVWFLEKQGTVVI